MAIANGVFKKLAYKLESAWGSDPGASGAQYMKRVTSDLGLKRNRLNSQQIISSQQIRSSRAGMKRVEGTISDELSAGTWEDFLAAALRRLFTLRTAISGLSITVAGTGPTYTITRAAGDWFAGGVLIGHIVKLTAGSFNALNLNKNVRVVSMTATVLTVITIDGTAMFAEGPIASATMTFSGKDTYVPASGHTNQSFTIEHWYSDIARSERFNGCKIAGIQIAIPANGMATIQARFLGKTVQTGASQYFTSPTVEVASEALCSASGALRVAAVEQGVVTALNISIDTGASIPEVAFVDVPPDVFVGRVRVSGSFSAFYENGTLMDAFVADTTTSINALLTGSVPATDFMALILPTVKLGSCDKSDGESGVIQTVNFDGLENTTANAGSELSTIVIQDSMA